LNYFYSRRRELVDDAGVLHVGNGSARRTLASLRFSIAVFEGLRRHVAEDPDDV
jgi:uncharacterized membrane protein